MSKSRRRLPKELKEKEQARHIWKKYKKEQLEELEKREKRYDHLKTTNDDSDL